MIPDLRPAVRVRHANPNAPATPRRKPGLDVIHERAPNAIPAAIHGRDTSIA